MNKRKDINLRNVFLSFILIFSMVFSNLTPIIAYGQEELKSDTDSTVVEETDEVNELHLLPEELINNLNEEQVFMLETFVESKEVAKILLEEAKVAYENEDYDNAIDIYREALSDEELLTRLVHLVELKQEELTEDTLKEKMAISAKDIVEVKQTEAPQEVHAEEVENEVTEQEKNDSEVHTSNLMFATQNIVETITSEKEVHFGAKLTRSNDGINTRPYGTEGYETIRLVNDWVGKEVVVTKEAVTDRATWAYVEVIGTNTSGWIDRAGLEKVEMILAEKNIQYSGVLNRARDGINTLPYGTPGYETIRLVNNWVGREVRVTKEAVTERATWAYVRVLGTSISGWIDKEGLEIETITAEEDIQYGAVLTRRSDGINSLPYGTEGYETLRTVDDWIGKEVLVTKEAVTPRATWAYIEVIGTDVEGWIDRSGLKQVEIIFSERNIRYEGKLNRARDGINTRPYGTNGYETLRLVDDWVGKSVRVTKEAVTERATWAYVRVLGTNISGWIDKEGLDIETVTSEKDVAYGGILGRSSDGINTRPYGTEGYETLRVVGNWVGREVRVTKEAVTPRATWSYIEIVGTDLEGWIDKAGIKPFETISSEQNIHYEGQLNNRNGSLHSKPATIQGSRLVRFVDDWVGRQVRVTKEAVTPSATWSYVQVVGTNVTGWIEKTVINIEQITSEKNVNYRSQLSNRKDGINTKPYGTEGYETIRLVDDLVGREVTVSKEAITSRGTWAYITVTGTDISGWIDKSGLKVYEKIISEKETNYIGKLKGRSNGINTKPFGTEGFKTIRLVGDLDGKQVTVTREAVTERATWSYIRVSGTDISGWIDKSGIDIERITSTENVSYGAVLTRSSDGINTRPYGTEGYKTVRRVGNLVNRNVLVTKEATTRRATWVFITVPGTNISGWVDKAGIRDNIVIYLDPGHGGIPATGGNPGPVYNGIREQDLNLTISLEVRDRLEKLGYTVVMSRENDLNSYHNRWQDDLYARPAHANEIGADILVSVHHNAHPSNRSVSGIETYYYGPSSSYPPLPENADSHNDPQRISESKRLADSIHRDLVNNTGAVDRGLKKGAHIVTREAKMPAVLLELGFMSNPGELRKLNTKSYQQKLIDGIVSGIHDYFLF